MLEEMISEVWRLKERYYLHVMDMDENRYWLFDTEEGDYFDLNLTSFFILSQFDGNISIAEIASVVKSRFEGSSAESDFADFFKVIQAESIIERVEK